ncbi:putative oxidoreductase [Rhodococcus opacus B4]|uniref:Putative oxidoreductase n=1 Tax=Rhodococcus opacus (strain B4) TaxID=632772 RepID=C1B8B6_RHOOB|nr:putative oxidoreductase [Rhodococcus opacus B4]
MELIHETGWAAPPAAVEPPLTGDIDCDVVVIGGVGGMSAALRLAEKGTDVVLLEAQTLGWGASSRNAGYITNSIAADPELLGFLLKRERLRTLYRYAENAVHFAEDAIVRHGIDCGYKSEGIVMAAVSKGQLRHARRNAKVMAEAGSSAEFVEGREAGLPDGFLGGMREGVGGTLNPHARRDRRPPHARRDRRPPQTEDELTLAGRDRTRCTRATRRDRLDQPRPAGHAAHDHRELPRHPARHHRVRHRRVQTGRNPLPDRTPARNVADDLVRGFRERFPGLRDVEPQQAWGGWIGMSSTWLPVAGEASDNVLYSLACNGHGFAQAQYVGHLLADRVGGAPLHDDLAAIWHGRKRFWPSLVSGPALHATWLADRATDRLAALTN